VIERVLVYCASSRQAHVRYRDVARRLGAHLASAGVGIVYGGGAVGSMGALAEARCPPAARSWACCPSS
jgi:predicted Rossmann-fold nucleotide-binding protein